MKIYLIQHGFCFVGIRLKARIQDEVQASGVGKDSSLYSLTENMCKYVVNSRSDNTVKMYYGAFKRWEVFIQRHGFVALPAQPVHIALYLTYLLDSGASCNTLNSAVYSLKRVHELNNFSDPTNNSYVHSLLESSKRIACPIKQKKDPVSEEMLIELCDRFICCNHLLVLRFSNDFRSFVKVARGFYCPNIEKSQNLLF